MTTHGSATLREETPHANETTDTTISDAVRRRARWIIDDTSIDGQWRAVIRYGLETNDPLLPELVQPADAGEEIIDTVNFLQTAEPCDDRSSVKKVEALTEIVCRRAARRRRRCSCSWEHYRTPQNLKSWPTLQALRLYWLR